MLCVLPPTTPWFCALCVYVKIRKCCKRISLVTQVRTFLQVCTLHAYRPIHVVDIIFSRAKGLFLGLMCIVAFRMEQMCAHDSGANIAILRTWT
jgi:hypothetical protein